MTLQEFAEEYAKLAFQADQTRKLVADKQSVLQNLQEIQTQLIEDNKNLLVEGVFDVPAYGHVVIDERDYNGLHPTFFRSQSCGYIQ